MKQLMMLLLLGLLTPSLHAFIDGEENDGVIQAEDGTPPETRLVETAVEEEPPPATPAAVSTAGHADAAAESCLFSIYRGHDPEEPPEEEGGIEIVTVRGHRFGTDFYVRSNLAKGGDAPEGHSFFLTRNSFFFGPSTSFRILDTSADGKQWSCSSSKRLRRLDNDENDFRDDDDAEDTEKTSADLKAGDQWGGGKKVSADTPPKAVYVVQAGAKFFRVSCRVGSRSLFGIFGAHKNQFCTANAIAVASPVPDDVRVCEENKEPESDFIEKAIQRRRSFFGKHVPSDKEGWTQVRATYDDIGRDCSGLISSDTGAKNALRELGKSINDKIERYNSKNKSASVEKVTLPAK